MAQKEKSSKKRRPHKESAGKNGGGGKTRLTQLEKVLIHGPAAFKGLGGAYRPKKKDRSKDREDF